MAKTLPPLRGLSLLGSRIPIYSGCIFRERPVPLFAAEMRSKRLGDETTGTGKDQIGNRVARTLKVLSVVTEEGDSSCFCRSRDLDVSRILPHTFSKNH